MSQQSLPPCSHQWSCDTLEAGVKHVMDSAGQDDEEMLLQQLQDTTPVVLYFVRLLLTKVHFNSCGILYTYNGSPLCVPGHRS